MLTSLTSHLDEQPSDSPLPNNDLVVVREVIRQHYMVPLSLSCMDLLHFADSEALFNHIKAYGLSCMAFSLYLTLSVRVMLTFRWD